MAYTDRRRSTFATLAAMRHFTKTWRDADIRIWLRPNDETGEPEVTRRTTNLRQYRIVGCGDAYGDLRAVGLKIWGVEDVETGQGFDLPPMGNGTTVWVIHPKAATHSGA
jgi:hypothetical protein